MDVILIALFVALLSRRDQDLRRLSILYAGIFAAALVPDPDALGVGWYQFVASIELLLILACIMARHYAGIAVAALSACNIAVHSLAMAEMAAGYWGPVRESYATLITMAEYGQAAALCLFLPFLSDRIYAKIRPLMPEKRGGQTWIAKPSNY